MDFKNSTQTGFVTPRSPGGNRTHLRRDSRYAATEIKVKVIARFRPLIDLESDTQNKSINLSYPSDSSVALYTSPGTFQTFSFDRVFDSQSTQEYLFQCVGQPICEDVVTGYNGTVFAYGQTGSGKTHTMMGESIWDPIDRGIIPRCASFLFDYIDSQESDSEFVIKVSMIEIYKESIHDLLNPESKNLKIKEDSDRGIFIPEATQYSVVDEEELLDIISIGESVRTVAATKMNTRSSRSHQIVMIEVIQKLANLSEKRGKLNLVDLAGSEKVTHSGVTGKNLDEAKKINLSLSCLGNVINALTKRQEHIPYRDSKLTRLLQESLGGNYKTTLIVNCSPHPDNFDDTISTLKFAKRAKTIKNQAKVNLKRSPADYMRIINAMKDEMQALTAELEQYRSGNMENPSPSPHDKQEISFESIQIKTTQTSPASSPAKQKLRWLTPSPLAPTSPSKTPSSDKSEIRHLKKKIEDLEIDKADKIDEIIELTEKLQHTKVSEAKKSEKLAKLTQQYKSFIDKMRSANDLEATRKQNEVLKKQVAHLTHVVKLTNFKYHQLIQKSMEAGLNIDDLEFEIIDFEDILNPDADLQLKKSIEINYADIPTNSLMFSQSEEFFKDTTE